MTLSEVNNINMKFKFLTLFCILFVITLLFVPFAYINATHCTTPICNPLETENFEDFITALIRAFTVFAAPILAFMVAIAGFQFMVSGGNPANRQKAINTLKYAGIGFIIIIAAWLIVFVLKGIF